MKKIALLVVLLATVLTHVWATAQFPDILIYEGKQYDLLTNPLEPFFEEHPDLRPTWTSTALWRGYVATFEIKDNQLVVKDVVIPDYDKGDSSIFKVLFPNQEKVVITWLTGILTLPIGDMVEYVHMGYGSTYNKYKLMYIQEGNLVQEQDFTLDEYHQYRASQFAEFKKTEQYTQAVKELKESESFSQMEEMLEHINEVKQSKDAAEGEEHSEPYTIEEMLDEFIFSFYSSQINAIYIPFPKEKKKK